MRSSRVAASVAIGVTILACAGCGQSGPAAIPDGSYAFLNSSQATDAAAGGQEKVASLKVAGKALTLTQATATTEGTIGGAAGSAALCPPTGKGEPLPVDGPLTIGQLTLSAPAIFGPCPDVAPSASP